MAIPVTSTVNAGTAGTLAAPGTPSATEDISATYVGRVLEVYNGGGSPITVTFTDPGKTPAGNTGTQSGFAVAAGARRRWKLTDVFVNATKKIRVTFSDTTSVTAEVID